MKKRIVSAILAASMLLSLAACNGDNNPKDTTSKDTTASVDDSLPAGIEKQNYGGDVNIFICDQPLTIKTFDPGDDMTDVLNKALYNREQKVEEHLGVNVTYEHVPYSVDYYTPIVTAVTTNDDLYQLMIAHNIRGNTELITGGYLADMHEMDIDFTGEWFNQDSNDALEVAGKQFFAVSDFIIPDPSVIIFNNRLVEEHHLEDPYQLVRDGEWTLDKMIEMMSVASLDNGDQVWDHEDTYGFSSPDNWHLVNFVPATGVDVIEKNDDGEFEFIFGEERTYDVMEKLNELMNNPDTYVFDYRGISVPGSTYQETALTIDSDRCLFTINSFGYFWDYRNSNVEFGILPFPKYDENQEDYRALDWASIMAVPFSVKEESYKMVGDVIELFSYYSEEEVIPAYLESTLGTKFARDPNWSEMIEIIFDNIVFDPALCYFGFSAANPFLFIVDGMLVRTGENNLSSFIAKNEGPAIATIQEFNDAVAALDR